MSRPTEAPSGDAPSVKNRYESDREALHNAGASDVSMPRIWLLGLALTLANPMTIALWLSIAAGFAASAGSPDGSNLGEPALRFAGVFSGAFGWVCFVTAVTAWARRWITPFAMRAVNFFSGGVLLFYSAKFLVRIFIAP